jgi:hypothetical protein
VHRSSGTCPPGMVLHIKDYALHGLISPRHHSNVNHISSLKLSNICMKSLTNHLRAQRHYTDLLYKAKETNRTTYWACYPRYLGITRRSCLEAHMVLDMEYREQERPEQGPGGPIFLLLSQTRLVSSTSFHHYWLGLASERTLAP